MVKKVLADCLFFLIVLQIATAQNIVSNPSFEEFTKCPINNHDFKDVPGWEKSVYLPSNYDSYYQSGCDYFNVCNSEYLKENKKKLSRFQYDKANLGVPKNYFGSQWPRTGKAYSGFCPIVIPEILIDSLLSPLVKDSVYYVEAFFSLAEYSSVGMGRSFPIYTCSKLGFYFSDKTNYSDAEILKIQPQVPNEESNWITDTSGWQRVGGMYRAKGGEKFLFIGAFDKDPPAYNIILKKVTKFPDDYAMIFYVDDVSTQKLSSFDKNVVIDKGHMIIDNTNFAFNSSALSKSSALILDKVCKFLKANSSLQIIISGFTDNIGDDGFNLKLSGERALSVKKYLVSKGIVESRIKTEGKGKSSPVASNESEEGKAKNRRVEIKIVSK